METVLFLSVESGSSVEFWKVKWRRYGKHLNWPCDRPCPSCLLFQLQTPYTDHEEAPRTPPLWIISTSPFIFFSLYSESALYLWLIKTCTTLQIGDVLLQTHSHVCNSWQYTDAPLFCCHQMIYGMFVWSALKMNVGAFIKECADSEVIHPLNGKKDGCFQYGSSLIWCAL